MNVPIFEHRVIKIEKVTMSEVAKLKKQMARLEAKLGNLTVEPAKNGKKKTKKRKSKGASAFDGMIEGRMTVRKRVVLFSVVSKANAAENTGSFNLALPDIGAIKTLQKVFERSKWLSCSIWYEGLVGSTVGGAVSIGMDWDSLQIPSKRLDVTRYSPSFTTPVWQSTDRSKMVLPKSRLMTRDWYYHNMQGVSERDSIPGTVAWGITAEASATVKTYGEVWADIVLELDGFTAGD